MPQFLVSNNFFFALLMTCLLLAGIFRTHIFMYVGLFVGSGWCISRLVPIGWWFVFWSVLLFVCFALAYFLLIERVFGKWIYPLLQRGSKPEVLNQIVGQKGVIRIIEGHSMFKWNEELWPIQDTPDSHPFADGEAVVCTAFSEGTATVRRLTEMNTR